MRDLGHAIFAETSTRQRQMRVDTAVLKQPT
jgi:hypothetical protein